MKQIFTILIATLFALSSTYADSFSEDEIKENLPNLVSQSSMGTEFVLTFHPCWEGIASGANRIYVTSDVETPVTIEVLDLGYKETKITKPNDVIIFTLEPGIAQPYRKTDSEPPLDDQVLPGRGIIITSYEPILVYAITDFTYSTDGYLALPIEALGNEYIVSAWEDILTTTGSSRTQWFTSYTSIVAAYDNTRVTFTMGGNDDSQTPTGLHPGDSDTKIMMRGDVWLIPAIGPFSDVTGSKIASNKPVAVISGNFCAYVPRDIPACDYLIEQEIPTNMWGNEYLIAPLLEREKNSWIRIFASEDSTKIFRDGNQIGFIKNAGGTEGTGWLNMRAGENEKRPIAITGNKPIRVVQYNTGKSDDEKESNPFQMNVISENTMSKQATFMSDLFNDTYLIFVYRGDEDAGFPENNEVKIYKNGNFVETISLSEWEHTEPVKFKNTSSTDNWFYTTFSIDSYKVYEINSSDLFAAYIYSDSKWDTYGFNANYNYSENLKLLDTAAPYSEFTNDCYGNVHGIFKDTITEPSLVSDYDARISKIVLLDSKSYNYNIYYDESDIDSSEIEFTLVVEDSSNAAKATITVYDRAYNSKTFEFVYFVFDLKIETESNHFKYTKEPKIKKDFTLNNMYSKKEVFLEDLYIENNPDLFDITLEDFAFEIPLEPSDVYSFIVEYTPEDSSFITDNIILEYHCENTNTLEKLVYPITAGTYKEFEIAAVELKSFPARFPLNELNINIENVWNDKSVNIYEISFSDNFGDMSSEETFRIDDDIFSGSSLPISINANDSISLKINPLLPNEGTYEGLITIVGDSTSEDINISVEAYETETSINDLILSGYEKSEIKDNIIIENTGEEDLYIFGTEFSGDAGTTNNDMIIFNKTFDLNNYNIINPGGSDTLSVTGNSKTADTTDGSIIISSNAKNELTSNIDLYVETLSSILDYKLISTFKTHYDNRNDKIIIEMTSREIYHPEIQLTDMSGNKALTISKHIMPGENRIELDCSYLLSGTYMLSVMNEGQPVASEKIVLVK